MSINEIINSKFNNIQQTLQEIKHDLNLFSIDFSAELSTTTKLSTLRTAQKHLSEKVSKLHMQLTHNEWLTLIQEEEQKIEDQKRKFKVIRVFDDKKTDKETIRKWQEASAINQTPNVVTENTNWTKIKKTWKCHFMAKTSKRYKGKKRAVDRNTLYICSAAESDGICKCGTRYLFPQNSTQQVIQHIKAIHYPKGKGSIPTELRQLSEFVVA